MADLARKEKLGPPMWGKRRPIICCFHLCICYPCSRRVSSNLPAARGLRAYHSSSPQSLWQSTKRPLIRLPRDAYRPSVPLAPLDEPVLFEPEPDPALVPP